MRLMKAAMWGLAAVMVGMVAIATVVIATDSAEVRDGHVVLHTESPAAVAVITQWDFRTGDLTEAAIGSQPLRVDTIHSPAYNGRGGVSYLFAWNGHRDNALKVCGEKGGDVVDAARAHNSGTNSNMKVTTLTGPVGRCGFKARKYNREWHETGRVDVTIAGPVWETARWTGPRSYH